MKTFLNTLVLISSLSVGSAFALELPVLKKGLKIIYPGFTSCKGTNPNRNYKKTITITKLNADGSFELASRDVGFNGFGAWDIKGTEKMDARSRAFREDMLNPVNCFAQKGEFVEIEIKGEMVRTCRFEARDYKKVDTWYFADKFALPVKMERTILWQAACEGQTASTTIDPTK